MNVTDRLTLVIPLALALGVATILVPALITHSAHSYLIFSIMPILYFISGYLGYFLRNKIFKVLFSFVFAQILGYIAAEAFYPTPVQNWIFPPIFGIPFYAIPLFIIGCVGMSLNQTKKMQRTKMTLKPFVVITLCAIIIHLLITFELF